MPRLYGILGRADGGIPHLDSDVEMAADDRGYADLIGRLFPPVGCVTWRWPSYRQAVAKSAAGDGPI